MKVFTKKTYPTGESTRIYIVTFKIQQPEGHWVRTEANYYVLDGFANSKMQHDKVERVWQKEYQRFNTELLRICHD